MRRRSIVSPGGDGMAEKGDTSGGKTSETAHKAAAEIAGMDPDDIRAAIEHPAAAREIKRLRGLESSCVVGGEEAPDFELPRLEQAAGTECVRLSDHFGKRPVALVFGSYT